MRMILRGNVGCSIRRRVWALILMGAVQASADIGGVGAVEMDRDVVSAQIQRVLAIPRGVLDRGVIGAVRDATAANPGEAVAFAIRNIGLDDCAKDAASLRIMVAQEVATLAWLKEELAAGRRFDSRMKKAMARWGRYVETADALAVVVNALLGDTAAAEDDSVLMEGKPRRFCDVAASLLIDRVPEVASVAGRAPLGTLDRLDTRDRRVALLRDWWARNGTNVKRLEGGRVFVTGTGN